MVLGAFGCGAFGNNPEVVANIYREVLGLRVTDFDIVAFAIHFAGAGEGNLDVFTRVLSTTPGWEFSTELPEAH